jgi:hypothetical protein
MKTSWGTSSILWSWYGSVVELTKAARPRLFMRTNKGIRRPKPLSYTNRPRKDHIPILAPVFNASASPLPHSHAANIRAMLTALHSDYSEGTAPLTSDDLLVVLDSGCTCAITFDRSDFVGPIRPFQNVELQGISSGLQVTGVGQVVWTFLDEFGERTTVQLTCLYVPDATTRLLPPQQLSASDTASKANGSWIGFGKDAFIFYEGKCIKFPYRDGSNLPAAKLAPGISKFKAFQAVCAPVSSPSASNNNRNDNLSAASRKLLRIHHRLGHRGFGELQKWAAAGLNEMPPDIATCPVPVCRACQYGAAKKRPHEKSNTGSVSGSPEAPGDFVSADQMVAGSPGLIPFTSGKPSKRRYDTVTMWVDHYSRFLYAYCQEDATTKSTLESKVGFENLAQRYNVRIKHIHSDNDVFANKLFKEHVEASSQHQSFCGVGAHWQMESLNVLLT